MMTMLDFELYFRPAKIVKSREMFLKGMIVELKKAQHVWVAKMKIGSYKTHIKLIGLDIESGACNCDDRPRSGYCDHKVAMLFAIRKELNLFPGLTNAKYRLPCIDTSLTDQLGLMRDIEFEFTKKYFSLFTRTSRIMLKDAESFLNKKNYASAAGTCFYIIASIQYLIKMYRQDYDEGDECINEAFELLAKVWREPMDEEHRDEFAHDARLAAIRTLKSDKQLHRNWLDIVILSADNTNRIQKMTATMDRLRVIDDDYKGFFER